MSTTLGSLCKKSLVNQSNGFEDVALNVDAKGTQNLALLPDAADFAKFLAMEDCNMSYRKPWDANRIESGPVMVNMSSKYLFRFPGALLYKIETGVRSQFSK